VSKIYFVATAHDEYRRRQFEPGSTVIDPWRMVPEQQGVTVRRLGENRPALISVLVPSRGRPEMFKRMYESAVSTAIYPRRIEVICCHDTDDDTRVFYPPLVPGLRYLTVVRGLLSKVWNSCADAAKGEILMHAGDDITFNTPGWDVRVREEFDKLPDKIGLVFADDLSTNFPDLATHGFLHRRWVETVGYFLPPLFSSDWNDVWVSEVAKKIGRFVPMGDVVIEHHHYTFGKAERDQTHADREERGLRDGVVDLFKRTQRDRENDAAKLKAVMAP
jgi:hypothetical protein